MKLFLRLACVLVCGVSLVVIAWTMRGVAKEAGGVHMVLGGPELERLLRERAEKGAEIRPVPAPAPATGLTEPPGGTFLPARRPIDPRVAAQIYPTLSQEGDGKRNPRKVYDPLAHFVNAPGWSMPMRWGEHPKGRWTTTYSRAGFRNPYEPAETKPEVRVIVCGDSHIEGVVPYEDTVAGLLERGLRYEREDRSVEVLNGASGGYDFYNYVGFLERSLPLKPDVFLLIIYGGNDFVGFLPLHAYYERIPLERPDRSWQARMRSALPKHGAAVSQGFQQVVHFAAQPAHVDLALEGSVRIMREIDLICRREGIALLAAYLPPMHDVRPQDMEEDLREMARIFDLDEDDMAVTDRLADRFLAELAAHGVEVVDLRPAMAAADHRLYWAADHHLSSAGQYAVARELFPLLRTLLPPPADPSRQRPVGSAASR